MGYLTVLHVRLGANFGDLHAKDSSSFCNRLISHAPLRRFHDLWLVREHQNIKNLDDLVGPLTIAPIQGSNTNGSKGPPC